MSSAKSSDNSDTEEIDDNDSAKRKPYSYEEYDESWDDWYEESVNDNRRSKLRRSKKRLYKNRDDW